ncbi:MAG: glycosyltransferase family 4 protein [Halobaculum sp.]
MEAAIEHVALYGPLHDGETGPSQVTVGLARGLASKGVDVDVVAHGDDVSIPGVDTHLVGGMPGTVRGFHRIHRRGRETVESLDADVTHSLKGTAPGYDVRTVQGTLVQLELLRRCRAEFDLRAAAGEVVVSYLSRRTALDADLFVATSPEVRRETETFWRVTPDGTVPLGVPADTVTEPSSPTGRRQVLFPGRLTPKKGQHRVLAHASDWPAVDVHIAGSRSDEAYADRVLNEWGDNYHGFVSRERLSALYESADIAVVPSVHECFSITALEAVAHGCVLVTMDTVGFGMFESVRDCPGVRVASDGAEAAEAVDEFVRLDDESLHSRQRAATDLSRQFTWEAVADTYLSLYQSL